MQQMNRPNRRSLPTGIVYDDIYTQHQTGTGHPESPVRCEAIMKGLRQSDFSERLLFLTPPAATEEHILMCHSPDYLSGVKQDIAAGRKELSTGDTSISERSFEAALYAAGGLLTAVDAVFQGEIKNAFCPVRPPGHHATAARGMGFCIFNNVAIAARYAQKKYGIGRVLIADWDIHHGNGTQEIFYKDSSVFYFSTHQSPWYPGTGATGQTGLGEGTGYTLNCPFPPGTSSEQVVSAFKNKLTPAARKFKPELVLVSAGFDSRIGDPLGGFSLTDDDYAELTGILLDIAGQFAEGRLISALEGGYNLEGLAAAVRAHVKTLATV